MAKPRPTFIKRQKERARLAKQAEKARRREERKAEKSERSSDEEEEDQVDPDIAGIVPGPQPLPFDAEGFSKPEGEDDDDQG